MPGAKPSKLTVLSFLIGTTGLTLSVFFNFIRNPETTKATRKAILGEVHSVLEESYKVELARKYQDRLALSIPENEIAAARSTLQELRTISHQNPLGPWTTAEQLTNPEYVEVLYEAGLIHRSDQEVDDHKGGTYVERRWWLTESGKDALAKNNFHSLSEVMERSQKRAQEYGITVQNLLYGRYWGVGLVTESSYLNCKDWDNGGEEEFDNRIEGSIVVDVLTGIMWHGRPYRAGETARVESKRLVGFELIRGCPKPGDIVGYVEYQHAQYWERILVSQRQGSLK